MVPHGDRVDAAQSRAVTFAGQWPALNRDVALNLGGAKPFAQLDLRRFRELARRCDRDPDHAADIVATTVERIAAAWPVVTNELEVADGYRQALRRHWAGVPLLAAHALLVA